jgi:RNA polymerase sigma-70 factor, ECF subfamily
MLLQEASDTTGLVARSEAALASFRKPVLSQTRLLPAEAILLEGLRGGDEAAFEEMVRTFGGRLLATARRYLRSEADACDALQDAFICAFKSIGKFRGQSQLSTWLHRIVINSALGRLRAMKQHPDELCADVEELPLHLEGKLERMGQASRVAAVDVCLEGAETRALVRRCIEQLPEAYRIVLVMRDIDELDTAEVAELLNLSTNNVRIRLHRGRLALKALIEREWTSVTPDRP